MTSKRIAWTLAALALAAVLLSLLMAYFAPTSPSAAGGSTLWANFWSAFNGVVLLSTLLVVAYYTYETYHLRRNAAASNSLSFRPIVVFRADKPAITIQNKGNGPALNACLIVWDGARLRTVADSNVPGVVPKEDTFTFSPSIEIDSAGLKAKLPKCASLVDRIIGTRHALFCVVYQDMFGERFYSITNGSNDNFEGVFSFGPVAGA